MDAGARRTKKKKKMNILHRVPGQLMSICYFVHFYGSNQPDIIRDKPGHDASQRHGRAHKNFPLVRAPWFMCHRRHVSLRSLAAESRSVKAIKCS